MGRISTWAWSSNPSPVWDIFITGPGLWLDGDTVRIETFKSKPKTNTSSNQALNSPNRPIRLDLRYSPFRGKPNRSSASFGPKNRWSTIGRFWLGSLTCLDTNHLLIHSFKTRSTQWITESPSCSTGGLSESVYFRVSEFLETTLMTQLKSFKWWSQLLKEAKDAIKAVHHWWKIGGPSLLDLLLYLPWESRMGWG